MILFKNPELLTLKVTSWWLLNLIFQLESSEIRLLLCNVATNKRIFYSKVNLCKKVLINYHFFRRICRNHCICSNEERFLLGAYRKPLNLNLYYCLYFETLNLLLSFQDLCWFRLRISCFFWLKSQIPATIVTFFLFWCQLPLILAKIL